jgi:hypothetical protein
VGVVGSLSEPHASVTIVVSSRVKSVTDWRIRGNVSRV